MMYLFVFVFLLEYNPMSGIKLVGQKCFDHIAQYSAADGIIVT